MGVFASYRSPIVSQKGECLSIVVFGAHPDDCELRFGGCALKYRALGHRVRFVSMTNGDTGHHLMGGGPLARRRYEEAQRAAQIADIEYTLVDVHNGELEPSVYMRKIVVQIIRESRADLVLCHRPHDYHPDHRAVGILVQDAAYIVTVPNVAPLTPALEHAPVVAYLYDTFKLPTPFVPTVAIDTDDVFERKIDMVDCHESQVYEWLPYNSGTLNEVPQDRGNRRKWLANRLYARFGALADDVRDTLRRFYGDDRAKRIRTAESVAISEYGRQPREEELYRLFPFLPKQ